MYAVVNFLGKNISTIKTQLFRQQYGQTRSECKQNHYYQLRPMLITREQDKIISTWTKIPLKCGQVKIIWK
jgi:ribosomal protein S24E